MGVAALFFYLLIPTEENNTYVNHFGETVCAMEKQRSDFRKKNVYMMPVVALSIKCKLCLESNLDHSGKYDHIMLQ